MKIRLFRNPEVKKTLSAFVVLTLVGAVAGFVVDAYFGIFILIFALAMIGIYLLSTRKRYEALASLAADIDRILHGADPVIPLNEYKEGELCILRNEIYKMTVRLREQKQSLMDDKVYLADSLADISHQLRTPLTTITLLVQLLRDPEQSESRKMELSRELLSMLSRIDWLITTLLKISKLDAGTVQFAQQDIPLRSLIETAAEPLQIPIELRDQKLSIHAEGNFRGDPSWTEEAVSNIIKNCMEHTPCGGEITVDAVDNALYTQIVIGDTGPGIDKEDLPHIFERFYKGCNSDSGSYGIGLALARMIVISQNGTLKAENNVNGGAKFTLRFFKSIV